MNGETLRELNVIPITFAIRGTVPLGRFQAYAILGAGIYVVRDEFLGPHPPQTGWEGRSQSSKPGAFLGIGGNVDLIESFFVGLESRYLLHRSETSYNPLNRSASTTTDLGGALLTAGVGFRF